jgi:predicted glycoside hydrolase/deacetylase ChbG (UPF0249 family)
MFPAVLKPLLRAANECGVRAIRNPFEPASVVGFADIIAHPALLPRWAAVRTLGGFAMAFRRAVARAGLATTDGTVGIAFTGHLTERRLVDLLRRLPEGTWELVTHPGYSDPALATLSRLTTQREGELRYLVSCQARKAIKAAGVKLISYADLTS